jgi:hypothetical protein
MIFNEYVRDTKALYKDRYGFNPEMPVFWDLPSEIQERMMRVGIEARTLNIDDGNVEAIMILAYCTILRDRMQQTNRYTETV